MTTELPDGRYDAFVVDATERPLTDGSGAPAIDLELTILSGAHKGEVVSVTAAGLTGSEIDLLGMPATLTVLDGRPLVDIDD